MNRICVLSYNSHFQIVFHHNNGYEMVAFPEPTGGKILLTYQHGKFNF